MRYISRRYRRYSERHRVPARRPSTARFTDRSLREITPALGRRNRHTNGKARRVLGWEPRPARETVLVCARSLIAHGLLRDSA